SRVRAVGLVEAHPEATSKVYVRYPGTLTALKVRDGELVQEGDVLAEFVNRDLEIELDMAKTDRAAAEADLELKAGLLANATGLAQRGQLLEDSGKTLTERDKAATKVRALERTREKELVLLAPRSGVVRGAPRVEDLGKYYEKDPTQPFCTITEPGRLRI